MWFSRTHGTILGRPARTAKRTTYTVTGTAADGTTATARIRLRIVR
ncbi:MAG: hypothetical protein ACO3ID_04965 [Candidatus Nanopelagicales bacterium]